MGGGGTGVGGTGVGGTGVGGMGVGGAAVGARGVGGMGVGVAWAAVADGSAVNVGVAEGADVAAVVPVGTKALLDEVLASLDKVSAKLNTANVTKMNKRYDIDKDDAETVAKDFVSAEGL